MEEPLCQRLFDFDFEKQVLRFPNSFFPFASRPLDFFTNPPSPARLFPVLRTSTRVSPRHLARATSQNRDDAKGRVTREQHPQEHASGATRRLLGLGLVLCRGLSGSRVATPYRDSSTAAFISPPPSPPSRTLVDRLVLQEMMFAEMQALPSKDAPSRAEPTNSSLHLSDDEDADDKVVMSRSPHASRRSRKPAPAQRPHASHTSRCATVRRISKRWSPLARSCWRRSR